MRKLILLAQNAQNWAFGLNISENKCQIWNQHLRNSVHAKFQQRIKKLILFGPKCLKLGISAQHFGKQMLDLKSAPSK